MTDRYRPRRAPVRLADVRDLTLGEVVERARRHGHFVAIATLALVVAVFFPGELPITRSLVPSGGLAQGGAQGAEVLGEQVAAGDGGVSRGSGARSVGDPGGDTGPPSFSPFRPDDGSGDPGDGGSGGPAGDGEPAAACTSDEHFPEPLIGPTLDQARAAQTAIEEGIGRPFPVDLVGTVSGAVCADGSASGADLFADLLVLGKFVPEEAAAPVLLSLDPIVSGACGEAHNVAMIEALALQRVSPATVGVLDLCRRVSDARPAVDTSETPSTPGVPEPVAPIDAEGPTTPVTMAPSWSSPAVLG